MLLTFQPKFSTQPICSLLASQIIAYRLLVLSVPLLCLYAAKLGRILRVAGGTERWHRQSSVDTATVCLLMLHYRGVTASTEEWLCWDKEHRLTTCLHNNNSVTKTTDDFQLDKCCASICEYTLYWVKVVIRIIRDRCSNRPEPNCTFSIQHFHYQTNQEQESTVLLYCSTGISPALYYYLFYYTNYYNSKYDDSF